MHSVLNHPELLVQHERLKNHSLYSKIKTQDDLILQSKYSRSGYFGAAKTSQGCGFQMCDGRTGYCRYDTEFLPSGQNWPIYNCGANLSFTWPYNSY